MSSACRTSAPIVDRSSTSVGIPTDRADTVPLVLAARAGDRDAFGLLYTAHARLVHGVLLANVRGDDVQDLVQDVFLAAMQQLHTLRDPAAFGVWLVTIARNRARMHHRAARPNVELSAALSEALPARGRADAPLEAADVLRALQSLPERYREPLTLRLVEEMSGEEIARHTGLTHGTVRVYLHHGLKLLREQLGDPDA